VGVDDDLEKLERLCQQQPQDPALAARLKATLLRLGRRDDLRARYARAFGCGQTFEGLTEQGPGVRHCGACLRQVHFAVGPQDLARLAARGHCMGLVPQALVAVIDAMIDGSHPGPVRRPEDPCLVPATIAPAARSPALRMMYGGPPPPVHGAPPPRR
jgi:hypothetical protein